MGSPHMEIDFGKKVSETVTVWGGGWVNSVHKRGGGDQARMRSKRSIVPCNGQGLLQKGHVKIQRRGKRKCNHGGDPQKEKITFCYKN